MRNRDALVMFSLKLKIINLIEKCSKTNTISKIFQMQSDLILRVIHLHKRGKN